MIIKSSVFKEGETIPEKFTCDGENVNPFLEIRGAAVGTRTLALVVDDPDASSGGIWDHWVLWNIPAGTQYIEEDNIPQGGVMGRTSFGRNRYGGPCPPRGSAPHHYRFKIYALDMELSLPPESGRVELEKAMEGHILDQGQLIGLYGRK